MDRASRCLQAHHFIEAVECLHGVVNFMEKPDRPTEIYEALRKEANYLRSIPYPSRREEYLSRAKVRYWDWHAEIQQRLFEKGYLNQEKWGGFHDPSGGQRSR